MSSFAGPTSLIIRQFISTTTTHKNRNRGPPPLAAAAAINGSSKNPISDRRQRRQVLTSLLSISGASICGFQLSSPAMAENWGTHSFMKEWFFQPELSPEDSAARIKQTAEGLHSIREMLETMSWRYVLFYVRLKQAYLSKDVRNALVTVSQTKKGPYIKAANELVDNIAELDYYIRTPKVYESYLFYEKTLTSIDELVALLA
ncbi:photosynthetic NDH subunit of lumenal location 2, chloroplastic [Impatiens glandulifera]|uniref:photosynthetic NDH subunit of lumenal location 2, chloroplastic n=1 Tax=Impatiens glandulifera TaxID=253017 RepID=UPI001FB0ECB6|nr:photosynthetic NDH subunit of lumenal location 2, chloroplastic [Impatiens glandulifera]